MAITNMYTDIAESAVTLSLYKLEHPASTPLQRDAHQLDSLRFLVHL
jgi:hypothetical protein